MSKNPISIRILGGVCLTLLLLVGLAGAQGSTIRIKPPGALATIARRDPDFSKVRFLGMQRNYRDELREKLTIGRQAIRVGRPVAAMKLIQWPPEEEL